MIICPFVPHGLSPKPKTCQIWYQRGPDFARHLIFSTESSMHLPRSVVMRCYVYLTIWSIWACLLAITYLESRWVDFLCAKFYGIVSTCSFASSWSFAKLTHMGSPIWPISVCPRAWMRISETAAKCLVNAHHDEYVFIHNLYFQVNLFHSDT